MPDIDSTDRALLNRLQGDFPLVRRPFSVLGETLGMTEAEALSRTKTLQDAGMLRAIAGIFDPAGLGFHSTLAALSVDAAQIDEAARVVNAHPGVSHNYAREHHFNLWFTLSLPAGQSHEHTIASLAKAAGANDWANMPALRVFKLRVFFDMAGGGASAETQSGIPAHKGNGALTLDDKRVVRQLCADLPLVEAPFDVLAGRAGMGVEAFLSRANLLQDHGAMRRFSAVLRHRKAGFSANGMTCWKVPAKDIEEAGAKASAHKEVSHCYERQTSRGWDYNLFAMVHGTSRDGCVEVAKAISQEIGVPDYLQLFSTREYKKEKVRYFEDVT